MFRFKAKYDPINLNIASQKKNEKIKQNFSSFFDTLQKGNNCYLKVTDFYRIDSSTASSSSENMKFEELTDSNFFSNFHSYIERDSMKDSSSDDTSLLISPHLLLRRWKPPTANPSLINGKKACGFVLHDMLAEFPMLFYLEHFSSLPGFSRILISDPTYNSRAQLVVTVWVLFDSEESATDVWKQGFITSSMRLLLPPALVKDQLSSIHSSVDDSNSHKSNTPTQNNSDHTVSNEKSNSSNHSSQAPFGTDASSVPSPYIFNSSSSVSSLHPSIFAPVASSPHVPLHKSSLSPLPHISSNSHSNPHSHSHIPFVVAMPEPIVVNSPSLLLWHSPLPPSQDVLSVLERCLLEQLEKKNNQQKEQLEVIINNLRANYLPSSSVADEHVLELQTAVALIKHFNTKRGISLDVDYLFSPNHKFSPFDWGSKTEIKSDSSDSSSHITTEVSTKELKDSTASQLSSDPPLISPSFSPPVELTVKEKLDRAITYLRDVHFYCFYCGIEYDSEEDMLLRCGPVHGRVFHVPGSLLSANKNETDSDTKDDFSSEDKSPFNEKRKEEKSTSRHHSHHHKNNTKPFQASIYPSLFSSPHQLKVHFLSLLHSAALQCGNEEDDEFFGKRRLKEKQAAFLKDKIACVELNQRYDCLTCGKKFKSEMYVIQHYQLKHKVCIHL